MSHFRIALPLALSIAIAPFALDTYLPAFPAMAEDFSVSIHTISFSISIYIFALALGQLVGGPLADRYGRAVVMMTGLSLFILTSFAITQLERFDYMLFMRALQAFGGGWVMVCVPALVRDQTSGKDAARLFSLIGLMTIAAPAVAPSIGSYLMQWGWKSIFYFLTGYGLIILLVLRFVLFRNGNIVSASPLNDTLTNQPVTLLQRYLGVLKTPGALRYVFLQGMLFSVMMLFVTHASFVYQSHFNLSSSTFALLFAANILTMWLTMLSNRILLNKFPPRTILVAAVATQALAVVALALIAAFGLPVYFYVPALMLTVGMLGATSPNCQACYMDHFTRNSGTASALMGSLQFGIAGIISGLSTLLPESLISLSLAQVSCSLIAVCLIMWPTRKAKESNQQIPNYSTN